MGVQKIAAISILAIMSVWLIYLNWAKQGERLVASYQSPDEKYAIEVYAYRELFSTPGDSDQGSGRVLLKEIPMGTIIEKKNCSMVGAIDEPLWESSRVIIRGFEIWTLPKTEK